MRSFGVFLYATMFLLGIALVGVECAVPEAAQPSGTIICNIPPEPVVREGIYMVAKEVTGVVTIKVGGKTYTGTLTFPDTKVRRTGVGTMLVDACVATGVVK